MIRTTVLIVMSFWLGISGLVTTSGDAAEPYLPRTWWPLPDDSCCSPQFGLCCDDYVRKAPPRIPCRVERSDCDDYRRRREPCVIRPQVTCLDDYDCKPSPRSCGPRTPNAACVPYCAHVSDSPASSTPVAGRAKFLWIR